MTDQALEILNPMDLLAELGGLGPTVSTPTRMELATIRILQSTSDDVKDEKAKAGDFIITFGVNSIKEPIYTSGLRVMAVDSMKGRVMWALKSDGQKDMTEKKPQCGSNNGDQPRLGEYYDYVGKERSDYRKNKEGDVVDHVITDSCKGCPLSQFIPAYIFKKGVLQVDDNGKALTEKKSNGKTRMLKPPCQETESHVVYLVDYGITAILRASSPTTRIGLKQLPEYFAPGADGNREFVKQDGIHCVEITCTLEEYQGNGNKTSVPHIKLSEQPIPIEWFAAYVGLMKRYELEEVRKALTTAESTDFDDENYADDDAPPASGVAVDLDSAKATLGSKGKGARRMAAVEDADTSDPFSE